MAGTDSADPSARRARLRQYQQQLLDRVQAASSGGGAQAHQLGLEIGGVRYLVDLVEAGEIVPLPALTAVPLTQPWYLGLANIRGSLVGVVDLGLYFGQTSGQTSSQASGPTAGQPGTQGAARVVTLAAALGVPCALLATRVFGLRNAADMQVDMQADKQADGGRLRDADGQAWTPLALAALVREERFLQVGL
jgi:twitching motility protein PilI